MSENYEMKIDSTGATAGAARIEKSFQKIATASEGMERRVVSAFENAARVLRSFTSIGAMPTGLARDVKALSGAMSGFKGPSQAATKSTLDLLRGLKNIGTFNVAKGSAIAPLLSVMANYKGPSASSARNTSLLLRSLSGFTGGPSIGRGLSTFMAALGGYRGPTEVQVRNTRAFLNALSRFTPPQGVNTSIAQFRKLAEEIEKAAAAMRRLSGSRGPGAGGGGGPTRSDIDRLRDYTNQHGALQTALLRTQTAFHALGGVLGAKFIIDASNQVVRIRAQLEAATGSTARAREEFSFLRAETQRLGLEFTNTAKTYGLLLASTKGVNITFEETREIFKGFATASRALQLSADDVGGVFRALGQILSKGKLQAEELRGQLGDRLPGAFVRFAAALDMTKPGELDAALKKGAISGDKLKNAILEVSRTLESDYAAAAQKASNSVDSAFNRLKNVFTFESAELGANGLNAALIAITDSLTKLLQSDSFNTFMKGLAIVFKTLGDNIEFVATIVGSVLVAKFILAAKAFATASTAATAFGAVLGRLGLVYAAASVGRLSLAFGILSKVIRANPLIFLAGAIATVIGVLGTMKQRLSENTAALIEAGQSSSTAANLQDYFTSKIDLSTSALAANTAQLRENSAEKLRNALMGTGLSEVSGAKVNLRAGERINSKQGTPLDSLRNRRVGGQLVTKGGAGIRFGGYGGTVYTGADYDRIQRLNKARMGVMNEKDFGQFAEDVGTFRALAASNPQKYGALSEYINYQSGRVDTIANAAPGQLGYDPKAILASKFPGYNGPNNTPLITGDVEPGGGKPKGSGGGGQSQYQNALERLIESMKDLKQEATNAQAAVTSLLAGGSTQDVDAAQAAADALSQMRGSFETQAEFEKAVQSTAAALGLQAKGFDQAKTALQGYFKEQELAKQQASVDKGVLGRIEDLKQENKLRAGLVDSAFEGADALARQEKLMEIELELTKGTAENREAILNKARTELRIQEQINAQLDAAKRLSDYRIQGQSLQSYQGLYSMGYNSDELEQAKKLLDLRGELERKGGYTTEMIQGLLDAEKATFRLIQADKKLQEEFERNIELGQDFADAIVDGFQKAISGGENFLDSMSDIFKNLKNIILDLVLYEPLRKWLTQILTPSGAGNGTVQSAGAAGAVQNSSVGNAISAVSTFANAVGATNLGQSSTGHNLSSGSSFKSFLTDSFSDAIVVTGQRQAKTQADATLEAQKRGGFFEPLKKVFDYKNNTFNDGSLSKIGKVLGDSNAKLGSKMQALGQGIGKVAQAAGQAYAAYEAGSGLAKSLGLGKTGQGIAGGAAAGYSLGGPIGAAVGAVIGGAVSFLKKTPSASANVTVDENGKATVTGARKTGKGDKQGAINSANAGISVFQSFADQFESTLTPGGYGTFGSRKKKTFYSTLGTGKKGKPLGREGVDYIYGDESQLQAFALKKQIGAGKFAGLDPIYQTIATNSTQNSVDGLNQDLNIGKAYLDFIDQATPKSAVQKNISDLQKAFTLLSAKSKSLGLDTAKLTRAYDLMKKTLKEDFNYNVNQEILGFSDSIMAEWNDLVKEYEQTVADGQAVGGDLLKVEELYGKKRQALIEQFLESGVNAVKNAGKDLLYSLTATNASPLSAGTVFSNAQGSYNNLKTEFGTGNYENADKLNEIVSSYLDAAKAIYGSNSQFFEIFNGVTGFLGSDNSYGAGTSGTGTPAENLPELPALQEVIAKLEEQKNALIESNNAVGEAILDGNSQITTLLEQILLSGTATNSQSNGGSAGGGGFYNIRRFGNDLV